MPTYVEATAADVDTRLALLDDGGATIDTIALPDGCWLRGAAPGGDRRRPATPTLTGATVCFVSHELMRPPVLFSQQRLGAQLRHWDIASERELARRTLHVQSPKDVEKPWRLLYVAPAHVVVVKRERHLRIYSLPALGEVELLSACRRDAHILVWRNTLIVAKRYEALLFVFCDGPARPPAYVTRRVTDLAVTCGGEVLVLAVPAVAFGDNLCAVTTVDQLCDADRWIAIKNPSDAMRLDVDLARGIGGGVGGGDRGDGGDCDGCGGGGGGSDGKANVTEKYAAAAAARRVDRGRDRQKAHMSVAEAYREFCEARRSPHSDIFPPQSPAVAAAANADSMRHYYASDACVDQRRRVVAAECAPHFPAPIGALVADCLERSDTAAARPPSH
jgi:hypothetical protein